MIKRRLLDAGLPTHYSPHSFRVAASNAFLDAGGRIEDLQFLLNHADIRTTRTYIVGEGSIKFEEICRINA